MNTYMILSYILFAATAVLLIVFLCMFRNIKLAIAIIKTAAICVKDNILIMAVPPVFVVLVAIFWVLWIYGAIYLYSVGEVSKSPDGPYAAVEHSDFTTRCLWYYLFGGFWFNAFL